MKKILFAIVAGFVPALVVTSGAYAQYSNNVAALQPAKDVIKMDKALISEKDNTVSLEAISTKAVKDFNKSYKMANDVKWYKVQGGFRVGFTSNGINNQVFYTKKGQWSASLKGYNEDKLSRDIRNIVKHEYYDYKINYIQEIETTESEGSPTYIVHLENDNTIKLVRVKDGEMDVYQEFTKDDAAK
jgi:hypothetical protein